jgi:hypothetical protein
MISRNTETDIEYKDTVTRTDHIQRQRRVTEYIQIYPDVDRVYPDTQRISRHKECQDIRTVDIQILYTDIGSLYTQREYIHTHRQRKPRQKERYRGYTDTKTRAKDIQTHRRRPSAPKEKAARAAAPVNTGLSCVDSRGGHAQLFLSPQSQFRNLKEALPQSQFRNF